MAQRGKPIFLDHGSHAQSDSPRLRADTGLAADGMPYRVLVFARQRPPLSAAQGQLSSPRAPGNTTPRTPTQSRERSSGTSTPTGRSTPQPARDAVIPPPKVEGSQVLVGNKTYVFDGAFDGSATQQQVYEQVAQPVLTDVLNGYSGCILAYGQTGSGKTHSLLHTPEAGGSIEESGLLPQLVADLFARVNSDARFTYAIEVSFCQVYNETIDDLLRSTGQNLRVRQSEAGDWIVDGLSWHPCTTPDGIRQIFTIGRRRLIYHETAMNKHSSRSHAVFKIRVVRTPRHRGDQRQPRLSVDSMHSVPQEREWEDSHSNLGSEARSEDMVTVEQVEGFLTVVDLAGSERLKRSLSEGARKVEATNINLSLFTLGQCVQSLASKSKHVPYRDSTLTKMLEANLSGHCRTCLLVCFAPERENMSETVSTLDFASRAMTIEVVPEIKTMSVRMSMRELSAQMTTLLARRHAEAILALEEDVADLEGQLAAGRRDMSDLAARLAAADADRAQLRQELEESQAEAAQLAEALRLMPGKQMELAAAYEERLAEERKIAEDAIREVRSAAERIREVERTIEDDRAAAAKAAAEQQQAHAMALAEAQARWREEAERSAAAHALALSELQARLRGEADERVAAQARLTEEAREEARAAHARVRALEAELDADRAAASVAAAAAAASMLELQSRLQREAELRITQQAERGDASTREALACAQSMAGALAKATEGTERARAQAEEVRAEKLTVERDLARAQAELAARDRALADAKADIDRQRAAAEADLEQREKTLAQVQDELSARDRALTDAKADAERQRAAAQAEIGQKEKALAQMQAELAARDRALADGKAAAERERAAARADLEQKERALAEAEAAAAKLREQLQRERDEQPQCNVVTAPFDGMNGLVQALLMGLAGPVHLPGLPEGPPQQTAASQQQQAGPGSAASSSSAVAADSPPASGADDRPGSQAAAGAGGAVQPPVPPQPSP